MKGQPILSKNSGYIFYTKDTNCSFWKSAAYDIFQCCQFCRATFYRVISLSINLLVFVLLPPTSLSAPTSKLGKDINCDKYIFPGKREQRACPELYNSSSWNRSICSLRLPVSQWTSCQDASFFDWKSPKAKLCGENKHIPGQCRSWAPKTGRSELSKFCIGQWMYHMGSVLRGIWVQVTFTRRYTCRVALFPSRCWKTGLLSPLLMVGCTSSRWWG